MLNLFNWYDIFKGINKSTNCTVIENSTAMSVLTRLFLTELSSKCW